MAFRFGVVFFRLSFSPFLTITRQDSTAVGTQLFLLIVCLYLMRRKGARLKVLEREALSVSGTGSSRAGFPQTVLLMCLSLCLSGGSFLPCPTLRSLALLPSRCHSWQILLSVWAGIYLLYLAAPKPRGASWEFLFVPSRSWDSFSFSPHTPGFRPSSPCLSRFSPVPQPAGRATSNADT